MSRNKKRKKKKLRRRNYERQKKSLTNKIVTFDDPILSKACEDVEEDEDLSFIDEMIKILRATDSGVGLAAPQIGVLKRVCLIWPDRQSDDMITLVNPKITFKSKETTTDVEGCLSYPDVFCEVERHDKIEVDDYNYIDEFNNRNSTFSGWEARIVQHEIDHISNPPVCYVGDKWRELNNNN